MDFGGIFEPLREMDFSNKQLLSLSIRTNVPSGPPAGESQELEWKHKHQLIPVLGLAPHQEVRRNLDYAVSPIGFVGFLRSLKLLQNIRLSRLEELL